MSAKRVLYFPELRSAYTARIAHQRWRSLSALPLCPLKTVACNSEYTPWDYARNHISIALLAQRPRKQTKQVQPEIGPEKAFGNALREIRLKRQISQEQLALDAGFDRTYISLMERGINSPTIRTLVKVAAVLKVAPSAIVIAMEQQLGFRP